MDLTAFIHTAARGGILTLALWLAPEPVPVTRQVYLMGTHAVLTAYAESEDAGRQQLETYLRILEDTEQELSVWRSNTSLSRLNATPVGRPFQADAGLFRLLQEVRRWWKDTEAAFDPAIGKLLAARGFYGPPDASLSEANSGTLASGMQHLELDAAAGQAIRRQDVWLDSGAFGKGEALDRVRRFSAGREAGPWVIDLGGQIMVSGAPPGRTAWPVDIAHPQYRDRAAWTFELESGSIAVSGNSERPGHILDPRTRLPVEFAGSVVVWHESGLAADILSTALFVMGPEKGLEWARARGVAACFLESKPHIELRGTPAFVRRFGQCR